MTGIKMTTTLSLGGATYMARGNQTLNMRFQGCSTREIGIQAHKHSVEELHGPSEPWVRVTMYGHNHLVQNFQRHNNALVFPKFAHAPNKPIRHSCRNQLRKHTREVGIIPVIRLSNLV